MRTTFVFFITFTSLAFSSISLADSAADSAAECMPTVARSPGMHYKPVTEFQLNTGKGLHFSGHVRAAGECKPVAGAKVGHWQANSKGLYADDQRAYVLSDKSGSYSFNTDWPAASESRAPHVYFIVIANGYKTLITRWDSEDKKTAQVNLDFVLEPATTADTQTSPTAQ